MAPTLPTRQMGRNGPQVTALGLGLMGLSAFYGSVKPDAERVKFLDTAYEMGERNWDSADMYADNEDLLGRWFKANPEKRDHIFLATKFANKNVNGERSIDSTPEYAKAACNKSLQRLGLPSVDLYYCHRVDGKTPIEKTIEAMVELKNEGKFKYLGISECSSDTLRRAHKVHPITACQIEYSPFTLDIEYPQIELLKTCRELGVTVVAYSPIGRGMVTGTIRKPEDLEEGDFRRNAPRWSAENFPKNLELVDKIHALAKKKNATPSQLTLAWLMAQGEDIIPIPGTTKIERLQENVDAMKINLTSAEEQEIRHACENADIAGDRYPSYALKTLFGDTPALTA
ncbi:MAG: hypothetical protein M1828_007114 [Chrysothrix sp. TS-e1954]|nr:MAG: hypothetical protein M1828_007114 [Chrysothrix sp. TS-e1954]